MYLLENFEMCACWKFVQRIKICNSHKRVFAKKGKCENYPQLTKLPSADGNEFDFDFNFVTDLENTF